MSVGFTIPEDDMRTVAGPLRGDGATRWHREEAEAEAEERT